MVVYTAVMNDWNTKVDYFIFGERDLSRGKQRHISQEICEKIQSSNWVEFELVESQDVVL